MMVPSSAKSKASVTSRTGQWGISVLLVPGLFHPWKYDVVSRFCDFPSWCRGRGMISCTTTACCPPREIALHIVWLFSLAITLDFRRLTLRRKMELYWYRLLPIAFLACRCSCHSLGAYTIDCQLIARTFRLPLHTAVPIGLLCWLWIFSSLCICHWPRREWSEGVFVGCQEGTSWLCLTCAGVDILKTAATGGVL
jgi:hypothetical protein